MARQRPEMTFTRLTRALLPAARSSARLGCPSLSVRRLSSAAASAQPAAAPKIATVDASSSEAPEETGLKPKQIVEYLDRYIVGQADAKRAVAVALRNRWRRQRVPEPLRDEITPKNILMIGPTGVGKTEVARRLAKLADAPFIKVEATKFTEVGFVGKDVDSIIKDLVEVGLTMARTKAMAKVKEAVAEKVEERLLDALVGATHINHNREAFRKLLREGHLDDRMIEVEVPERKPAGNMDPSNSGGFPMNEIILRFDKMAGGGGRPKVEKREMMLKDAVPVLTEIESEKLISDDEIKRLALWSVEQEGIVFIDEIDKICSRSDFRGSADASSEGVQRDLLPLIEGSQVSTKHGNVNTDHILFVASGAFHTCKPSDLLAELQGRLPVRVELNALTEGDLYTILTEPENNLCRQHEALVFTEGVNLEIGDDAKKAIARLATQINRDVENIGARRLHTIMERLTEELAFTATDRAGESVAIGAADVETAVESIAKKTDLSRFIL